MQSHLSDALIEQTFDPKKAELRIRLVKRVLLKMSNELKYEIHDFELYDMVAEEQAKNGKT